MGGGGYDNWLPHQQEMGFLHSHQAAGWEGEGRGGEFIQELPHVGNEHRRRGRAGTEV